MQHNSPALWKIPPLQPQDHKYSRGHVLVYGGPVLTGASRLSALAALRIGAGMVTLAAPEKAWPIYAESLVSVITRPLKNDQDWDALIQDERIRVVIIGPGAGTDNATRHAIIAASHANKELVLDADALTLLAQDASLREAIKGRNVILTPHDGEYARLAKALHITPDDKVIRARELALAMDVTVVLKGAQTVIANRAEAVMSDHAPAWLATAGSGDVLSGMIGGLWAQGMSAMDAACAGVWLHGEAAFKLKRGMIAEDILPKISEILSELT